MKYLFRIVSLIGILAVSQIAYSGSKQDIENNAARITALEAAPKANIATTAPTVTDDITGYPVGSVWVDITQNQAYILVDSAPGAAVWKQITNAAIATNEIFVIAVSRNSVGLNGTYTIDCISDVGGETSTKVTLVIAGNTWTDTTTDFTSADCTMGATANSITAAIEIVGPDFPITGWVNLDGGTTAPTAEDGSGPISDTQPVTPLRLSVGDGTKAIFYVVDDTGANIILYHAFDFENGDTRAITSDRFTKQ